MSASLMNALVLHAVGDARYERIPVPEPGAREVRVRVGACGFCSSDMARFFGKGPYSFPLVCGHEFAGTVEKAGEGVEDFEPGDRVAVFPLLWCGVCQPCIRGTYAQCVRYDYLGSRSNGGFAEFVVAPTRNLLRVPEGLSLDAAAMIEPAAVALHALRQAGGCSIGDCVVVFGAGPIGLMVARWARVMGASRIVVFDVVPDKLRLARLMQVEQVFDARESPPVRVVEELTGGQGADVCIDAAGVPSTTIHALQATRRGGRVVILGNPSADVNLPASLISQVLRRELRIHGTWNSDFRPTGDDDWHNVLAAMASGVIDVGPLVSHRAKLADAFQLFKDLRDRTTIHSKVLIYPESGA
jgi:L-iditol 2-dehydrogenase